MAVFKGHPGQNDNFSGSEEADHFVFHAADLDAGDHISGGDGDAVDELRLVGAAALSAADLANVSGIERVRLANATNSFQLSSEMTDTAWQNLLTVDGGSGADTVDGSAASSGAYLVLNGHAGDDVLTGGPGGADLDGGARRDELYGLDFANDTFVIGRGDFAKGEVYADAGFNGYDNDVLLIGDSIDLREATVYGIETWVLGAIDRNGAPVQRKITVDVSSDQLYSVSSIHTYAYEDPSQNVRETLNIHLIAGHYIYIPSISSDSEDLINIIGTKVAEQFTFSGGFNARYYGRGGDDYIQFAVPGGKEAAYGGAGNDKISYTISPDHHRSHAIFDGGAGNDTLGVSTFFERNIIVRLAEDDQVLNDGVVSRHFENFLWYSGGRLDAVGDAHDNIIKNVAAIEGAGSRDTLDGGGGDDMLDGGWGGAIDTLTGGPAGTRSNGPITRAGWKS